MEQEAFATQDRPGALARGGLPVMGLHLGRVGLQFVWVLLLARQLGPGPYGSFSAIVSLGLVLGGVSGLGFGLRLYQDTARDPLAFSQRWHEATFALFASALPLCVLFVSLGKPLFPELGLPVLLAVAVVELLLSPLIQQVAHAYAAHGRVAAAAGIPLLVSGGRIVAALLLPVVEPVGGLTAYSWLHCLTTACVAVACWLACSANLRPGPTFGQHTTLSLAGLRAGVALSGVPLAGNALGNADKIASLRWGGAELAGHFTAAQRFVSLVCLPLDALMAATMPRLFDAGLRRERRRQLLMGLSGLAAGFGLLAGGCVWLAAPLLGWVLGREFEVAVPLVQAFAWLVPAYALRQVGTHALLGFGFATWRVACETIAALVLVLLIARWLPAFGASGTVRAVVVTEYLLLAAVWCGLWAQRLREP